MMNLMLGKSIVHNQSLENRQQESHPSDSNTSTDFSFPDPVDEYMYMYVMK